MKRWIKRHFVPYAIVLMYHRVTELQNDPYLLAVSRENFEAHLQVLRMHCSPITLSQLADALRNGNIPRRAAVITFDDGYADNLFQAKPLLDRFEIPATVFVTTGHVESKGEFWWDELDRLLLQPGTLPTRLQMKINKGTFEWDLGDNAMYSQADYLRDQEWHIEREDDPTLRHSLFRELYKLFFGLPEGERRHLLEELLVWAEAGPDARFTHQTLTFADIVTLASGDLVDIGAHTMTHPALGCLSPDEQRVEIQRSKKGLETALKRPVASFAFPHGSYTGETVSILEEEGFVCSCTSKSDVVWQGARPFEIPRLGVRNWDRQAFGSWLDWWLDG